MKLVETYVEKAGKNQPLLRIKELDLYCQDIVDISVLRRCLVLERLNLSGNSLNDISPIQHATLLTELYLRNNNIDQDQLQYLEKLKNLKILNLNNNPITKCKNYRQWLINSLPNLVELDHEQITSEERQLACETIQSEVSKVQQEHEQLLKESVERTSLYRTVGERGFRTQDQLVSQVERLKLQIEALK